jgi:hypothetical protein
MFRILNWFRTGASRSAARRPPVALCLETLGERLLPSHSPLNPSAMLATNVAAPLNAANLQAATRFTPSYGIYNLANQHVQLTTSSGRSDGTLTITSEDANGNFQGVYSNPNLTIDSLAVHGTVGTSSIFSASCIHFAGAQTKPLPYGSDVQTVTFDGTLQWNGQNLSTTGTIHATDKRSAGYVHGIVGPQSPLYGAVGVPDATLVQQGRTALPVFSEVNDTVSGTFVPV